MMVSSGVCIGLIPARGGSKSIPLKNLHTLAGRPLIDYQIDAARAATTLQDIVCDTDNNAIVRHCGLRKVRVHCRPDELGADDTPVADVVRKFLDDEEVTRGRVPEMIALLQPTSPFLLPAHIDDCVKALTADPTAMSAQTVVAVPHNAHAINQRIVEDGRVRFRFEEERAAAYNKQKKAKHWLFGNLLVFRSVAVRAGGGLFPQPSLAVSIDNPYDFDADNAYDFRVAEALLAAGLVEFPHRSN